MFLELRFAYLFFLSSSAFDLPESYKMLVLKLAYIISFTKIWFTKLDVQLYEIVENFQRLKGGGGEGGGILVLTLRIVVYIILWFLTRIVFV